MTRRMSLTEAVEWIAENDEPGDLDPTSVDGYISTMLVADIYGKSAEAVAQRVVTLRRQRLAEVGVGERALREHLGS